MGSATDHRKARANAAAMGYSDFQPGWLSDNRIIGMQAWRQMARAFTGDLFVHHRRDQDLAGKWQPGAFNSDGSGQHCNQLAFGVGRTEPPNASIPDASLPGIE